MLPFFGIFSSSISRVFVAAATPSAEAWNFTPTCLIGAKTSGANMIMISPTSNPKYP